MKKQFTPGFRVLFAVLVCLMVGFRSASAVDAKIEEGSKKLPLSGESFRLNGQDAFVILPPNAKENIPWVWYAPTLPGLPAKSEVWMFEQFLANGIAIAGIDVGESYGSPTGRESYTALYGYLVETRKFRKKPCLLARSRGGLMLYSWAIENPQSVAGVAGIYPVCNIASYPGVDRAAGAYGMTANQLKAELSKHNPIDRLKPLAEAGVPILHIHGDIDKVVPLETNSGMLGGRYSGLGGPVEIDVIKGQGHNMWDGWFQSQKLTDFAIASALGKAVPSKNGKIGSPKVPNPIAYWSLDDEGGTAADAMGTHHGKIVGAKSAPGKVGKSLEFVRKEGDHVLIPFSQSLALSTFTVTAWVYLTHEPTFSGILGTRHGGDHTFDLKVNDAKVHGDIGDGKNWIETAVNFYADDTGSNGQGGDLALERWYHIAYVIDSEKKECLLYLDADLKKQIGFEGTPILMTSANTMHLGHSSGTEFMDGRIDEVKIWNQALRSDQIRSEFLGATD